MKDDRHRYFWFGGDCYRLPPMKSRPDEVAEGALSNQVTPGLAGHDSPVTLCVSVVTYRSDRHRYQQTLKSLAEAAAVARESFPRLRVVLASVDNSPGDARAAAVETLLTTAQRACFDDHRALPSTGNIGFGRAHNLVISAITADYHIIANPDIVADRDAIAVALEYLQSHEDTVLAGPVGRDEAGSPLYLPRAYPSVLVLLARAFFPRWLNRGLRARLSSYELRDRYPPGTSSVDVELLSGCFLVARGEALRRVGGFSEEYFLYFEDYDLSMRMRAEGRVVALPGIGIVHFGGGAARKGLRHVRLFVAAGITFFRRHGWRWF